MEIKVKVPGKIMLAGEYGVLFGGQALAATVNRYLDVSVKENQEADTIHISSDLWTSPVLIDPKDPEASNEPLIQTVIHATKIYGIKGVKITITSQLDPSFGMGSSSGLRLGVIAACYYWCHQDKADTTLDNSESKLLRFAKEAHRLQREQQFFASGYDILTQALGGCVAYASNEPLNIDKFILDNERVVTHLEDWPGFLSSYHSEDLVAALNDNVHILSGGDGAPTKMTILKSLDDFRAKNILKPLVETASDLSLSFINYLEKPNDQTFAFLKNINVKFRDLMSQTTLFPQSLTSVLDHIEGCDQTWTYKTTGAGGEDSILLIGPYQACLSAINAMEDQGWQYHNQPFANVGTQIRFINKGDAK